MFLIFHHMVQREEAWNRSGLSISPQWTNFTWEMCVTKLIRCLHYYYSFNKRVEVVPFRVFFFPLFCGGLSRAGIARNGDIERARNIDVFLI